MGEPVIIPRNQKFMHVFVWMAVVLWMLFIFFLSSQPATVSNGLSKSVTRAAVKAVEKTDPSDSSAKKIEKRVSGLNNTIRKYAHTSVYLVLAVLIFIAFKRYGSKRPAALLFSFLICALFAASDEFHQLFVPGRSSQLLDFALDCAGAATGLLLYTLASGIFVNLRSKRF
jgi:VanZ family protein